MRKQLSTIVLAACLGLSTAQVLAQASAPAAGGASVAECEKKAVSKDGKPLAGAAKTAFVKKCSGGASAASSCEAKAVSKDGKPLAGAAKNSFMKKCEAEAK